MNMGCVLDPRYQFGKKANELLRVSLGLYRQNCILFDQVVYSFLLVSGNQFLYELKFTQMGTISLPKETEKGLLKGNRVSL